MKRKLSVSPERSSSPGQREYWGFQEFRGPFVGHVVVSQGFIRLWACGFRVPSGESF